MLHRPSCSRIATHSERSSVFHSSSTVALSRKTSRDRPTGIEFHPNTLTFVARALVSCLTPRIQQNQTMGIDASGTPGSCCHHCHRKQSANHSLKGSALFFIVFFCLRKVRHQLWLCLSRFLYLLARGVVLHSCVVSRNLSRSTTAVIHQA